MTNAVGYELYTIEHDDFTCVSEFKGKDKITNINHFVGMIEEYGHEEDFHMSVIKHYFNKWEEEWDRVEFSVYPDRQTEGLPKYVNKIIDAIYSRLESKKEED